MKRLYIKSKKHFIILVVLMAAIGFFILNVVFVNKFGCKFLIYEGFIMMCLSAAAMGIYGIVYAVVCFAKLVKKAIGFK